MQRKLSLTLFMLLLTATTWAATVDFEQIVKTGDPVPGREGTGTIFQGRAFQTYSPGVFSRPSINELGDVVFRGVSSDAADSNVNQANGLYLKRPGADLTVIVDSTLDEFGDPSFPVPDQPAGTRFGDFKGPLINNSGDIIFQASYITSSGTRQGFYAAHVDGRPIVKIADASTEVPGWPGTLFDQGFSFSGTWISWVNASLNDAGQVVFIALFKVPSRTYVDTGMYGTSIGSGTIVRLADSTNTVQAGGETYKFLNISQGNQPAINSDGMVLFEAGIGANPAYPLWGIFAIPVDGSTPSVTVARKNQTSPLMSDGVGRAYYDLFDGHDINDNGDIIFQHSFQSGSPATMALFGGTLGGGALRTIVDNLTGGYEVPGTPGATFYTLTMATINEHGQMGFYADNTISNGQGIYGTDLVGEPLSLIANNTMPPPGQITPATFQNFNFNCAEVNEQGNMVLAPTALNEDGTDALFGLYFWDNCTRSLERLVDSDTAPLPLPGGLNGTFAASGCAGTPCERGIYIHQGFETRSGHYHAINNSNEIAFLTAFSTFDVHIFVARVTSGAGPLAITCPDQVILECPADTSPAAVGEPEVSGCGAITVTYSDAVEDTCGNTQVITRTWSADNGVGSPATCDQIIRVVDNTPPTLTIPIDVTISCDADTTPAATGMATAIDTCDDAPAVTFADATTPGDCPENSVITRTWTATDACGNSVSADQIITIEDTTAPTITVPDAITVECGESTLPDATGTATAIDDCDAAPVISYADVTVDGACVGASTITRTWTATDACGNAISVDQVITVVDSTAPALVVPADANLECGDDTSTAATGLATATDVCDPAPAITYTDSVEAGTCPGAETITRTWTATDACGNTVSADQMISVTDSTAPSLILPADVNLECGADTSTDATGFATATDICDPAPAITYADSVEPGVCTGDETITRTWTATDACGNVTSAAQIITVADTLAPVLGIPADVTISCDEDSSTAATGTATAMDDCDPAPAVTFTETVLPGDCDGESIITRTWTATDACGNAVSDIQVISLVDTIAPTLTVPADVVISCESGTDPADTGEATASDNCVTPTITYDDAVTPGSCAGESMITRTWTASDGCGNTVSADQLITLSDEVAPVLTIPADVTLNCDDDTSPAGTGLATATDNCDAAPVVTYADVTNPGSSGESIITRTWTADDDCGNTATGDQIITVSDVTAPVLTVPADVTLECGDDTTPAITGYATAIDNCDPNPVVTFSDEAAAGSCASEVVITRTWTATDLYGNASDGVQIITLEDNEAPTLTLDTTPIYVTDVDCDGVETVTLPVGTATDNCPGPVTITNDAPASFLAGETTEVTFTATDGCGNSSSQTVEVTVGHGSAIRLTAKKYTIGVGCRPSVQCEPLRDIPIAVFDLSCGSCALDIYLHYWLCMSHALPQIYQHCDPITTGVTNYNGVALLDVPPGDYIVASHFDNDGDGIPETYLGTLALNVHCGETQVEYLFMIEVVNNRRMGCKWHYFHGSELIVVEPEEVLWDDTEQLYPFVFDSEGDWDVNVSVMPPEGFVSDYDELADTVDSELKALQFTITEVGSDLVPTISHFEIEHKGRRHIFDSSIDIKLTPDYARSRGFNVEQLRQRGLIIDKQPDTGAQWQQEQPANEQPASEKPRNK